MQSKAYGIRQHPRSKFKNTLESQLPETYQSNLSTFNVDTSLLNPKTCDRAHQSTYNKATFVHGAEEDSCLPPDAGNAI